MRSHERVQTLAKAMLRQTFLDLDMRAHRHGVDPGICPASCVYRGELASHLRERFFQRLLDRRPMILPLPAHEGAAVIFDGQPPACHCRIAPFEMLKPRNNSPDVMTARPARWTFNGRM